MDGSAGGDDGSTFTNTHTHTRAHTHAHTHTQGQNAYAKTEEEKEKEKETEVMTPEQLLNAFIKERCEFRDQNKRGFCYLSNEVINPPNNQTTL